jgi:hypothetical protein
VVEGNAEGAVRIADSYVLLAEVEHADDKLGEPFDTA